MGILSRIKERLESDRELHLPLSTYGKLPIYKDFLRSGMTGKEAQAVRQWLDRGISHYWASRPEYREQPIFLHALLLRFTGVSRVVIGVLWGSHDEGMLRKFPFICFTTVPACRSPVPSLAMLDLLSQVVDQTRRWKDELAQLASVESFYGWSRGRQLTLTERPERIVRQELIERFGELTIGDYATALYGEEDPLAAWATMQRTVDQQLAGNRFAAWLPSASRGSILDQGKLWCSLLTERASRGPGWSVIIPLYDERSGLVVMQRPLRDDDVFVLHPEMPSYEFVEDLRPQQISTDGADLSTINPGQRLLPVDNE